MSTAMSTATLTATLTPSSAMADRPTIMFAGGGTGGHIFPNLAVVERLRDQGVRFEPHFLISRRPLDAAILNEAGITATPLAIEPPGRRPWGWPRRLRLAMSGIRAASRVTRSTGAAAVVATGGFVSVAAARAARRRGLPLAVVNLDAVPGRANRLLVGRAERVFTAYPWPAVRAAESIGVPLRRRAVDEADSATARSAMGLDPSRETLLIVGGSQGAGTLNAMGPKSARALGGPLPDWQWLHLAGSETEAATLGDAYRAAGVEARVLAFSNDMGRVWRSATVAVSRAGAGSVAEAWANGVPTIFLPYPHHRDQHQRLNAAPMAASGGALIIEDAVDAQRNADAVARAVMQLVGDVDGLESMRQALQRSRPTDGAAAVARWVAGIVGGTA